MKKAISVMAGLALVAGSALASNTGFKLNYPLTHTAGLSNANWVSTPWFYYPNGNVGITQTATQLCEDLNGAPLNDSRVERLIRWVTASDVPQGKGCATAIGGWNLVPGEALAFVPKVAAITVAIVGSHDDSFSGNKSGVATYPLIYTPGLSNANWVSIPYHSISNTATELCVELNRPTGTDTRVERLIRWVTGSDVPQGKGCATAIGGWTLVPGEGVALVPKTAGISVQFDVF